MQKSVCLALFVILAVIVSSGVDARRPHSSLIGQEKRIPGAFLPLAKGARPGRIRVRQMLLVLGRRGPAIPAFVTKHAELKKRKPGPLAPKTRINGINYLL